jgi:predicted transcriptional regulator of viral defense system
MATKKMSDVKLLQILRGFNKSYFTVADFEKILAMKRNVLYVSLNRLVKSGVLVRLKRGVYKAEFQSLELEKISNELYFPSYLSFESVLSRYGILSQTPYSLTFATIKQTKKLNLTGREVEYRKLKKELYFGYRLVGGIYIAEPEKAVLDELYLMSKGKVMSDTNEWSLVGLDKKKLLQYAKKFPLTVQKSIEAFTSRFGKYITTLEKKEAFRAKEN